jgi:predicted dehydrogenase
LKKLRAAIIGLGQAGSRFDEEPRGAVWSHAGAYLALPEVYELIAGVDPDAENCARFVHRCPSVSTFVDARNLGELEVDVVSVATPPSARLAVFKTILSGAHLPRVIVCEKPLATDASTRSELIAMCEVANVTLLVHYNRRYTEIYRRFALALRDGLIGDVASITVRAPNRLWSIGSHALDLLLFLAGESPRDWRAMPLPALTERGEPAGDFICTFPSGSAGRMLTQGLSRVLIFEVDAVGSKGRLVARGNGQRLELTSFVESSKYLGYLESTPARLLYRTRANESAFIAVVREAASVAHEQGPGTCTGKVAQISEEFLDQIIENVEAAGT